MRLIQKGCTLALLCFVSMVCFSQNITRGFASTYPIAMEGGNTASGEKYIPTEFTASHKNLPFNTLVKVTNLKNNKSIIVRINDRFSFRNSRLIDISNAAATAIDLFEEINPQVSVEVIGMADAVMMANVKRKQEELIANAAPKKPVVEKPKVELAKVKETPAKPEPAPVQAKVKPAPVKAPATTGTVVATANTTPEKLENPGFLSSIKIKLPSISMEDINDLATISIKYLTISLFK